MHVSRVWGIPQFWLVWLVLFLNVSAGIGILAMDPKGYRNLTELISRGWTDGQRNGLVILQREWIAPASEGLIALSAGKEGDIGMALLAGRQD